MKPQKWLPGLLMPLLFLLLLLLLQLLPGYGLPLARAQAPGQAISPGQEVPDVPLAHLVNYPTSSARLSDFRGKLLVLEFWATWCGSCKAAMPKLDALQREFPDELQVLLVNIERTGDTEEKIKDYFDRWRRPDGSPYALASVIYDSLLYDLFPNRLIPHLVWIDTEGRLLAHTNADQATPEAVRRLLRGEKAGVLKNKQDQLDYDPTRPLFFAGNGGSTLPTVRSQLALNVEGLPGHAGFLRTDSTVRLLATNLPLVQLCKLANGLSAQFPGKQVLLEKPSARQTPPGDSSQQDTYSYELLLPRARQQEAHALMRQDLARYLGVQTLVEKRRLPCWVLERRKGGRLPLTSGGEAYHTFNDEQEGPRRMQNLSAASLVAYLDRELPTLPVLDHTHTDEKLDLQLRADPQDLAALNAELAPYGLRLRKRQVLLEVLIIR